MLPLLKERLRWLGFGVLMLLNACATQNIERYQNNQPQLDLAHFFLGSTDAWGMFQDRNGNVIKRFTVHIEGTMQGKNLVLDERFNYSDGTKQQRIWYLQQQSNGMWRGTAADVVGEAYGEIAGNALHWQYQLRLPVGKRQYIVHFDDWMFLIDQHTMLNRAKMSKFGFGLGDVTLSFHKASL